MLTPKFIPENTKFIARDYERKQLIRYGAQEESAIIVIHGRRRVGKTELLEQTFRERNILKFEGLESKEQQAQRDHVVLELSKYVNDPFIAKLKLTRWVEVFELIAKYVEKGTWTVYFEEVQWLANYQNDFASELKYVWDNYFRYNHQLLILLCGSSPAFMIRQIVNSKALYNRSMYEIPLSEFTLIETKAFLPKLSDSEVLDAQLILGGIPEYLKRIRKASSVFLGVCELSFTPGGTFLTEYKKIFVSSLGDDGQYKAIIDFLSQKQYASRNEIAAHLNTKPGGTLSGLLDDLELCGFIEKYTPYNTKPSSTLARFCIQDAYLHFYFKFIHPIRHNINQGDYKNNPVSAITHQAYRQLLGYAFERFCRRNHRIIANILRFSSVRYKSGVYFNRATSVKQPGFQIDLIFDRDDHVLTVCEIRYTQKAISRDIIPEFEQKLGLLQNPRNKTIHSVLISCNGATDGLMSSGYFDKIITMSDLFDESNWR